MCPGLVAAPLLVTAFLSSQVGRLWTFSDLLAESHFVFIGKAADVRDTGRKATHPDLRPDLPVVELETEVRVLAVLKRGVNVSAEDVRRVVLHHYRLDLDEWRRQHPAVPWPLIRGLLRSRLKSDRSVLYRDSDVL